MAVKIVTAPSEEPITLEQVKLHLRIDDVDSPGPDDALLETYIAAARANLDGNDGWLQRCLVTQTWELKLDEFPADTIHIQIPLPPLQSIVSVKYLDEDGVEQTVDSADYTVDNTSEPGWIAPGESGWPDTGQFMNAVIIRFTAGYGAAADVPPAIKAAMLLMLGNWYQNREEVVIGVSAVRLPFGADALLFPYRIWV